ncbi:hypothetical protein [Azospirillum sp. sgz301742]
MDDQERERLSRHRELMELARHTVEEARRMRGRFDPAPAPAHIRNLWLSARTTALISLVQEERLRFEDARAKTREAIDASMAVSSRYIGR